MNFEILFVLCALIGMIAALIWDKMRPGMVLFSVVVLFLCAGIISPKEMLEGFSNKGMITVALLFLVSEGVRQSGALTQIINKVLPQGKTTVFKAQLRMLPSIAFIKQHAGRGDFRADNQTLGEVGTASGYQVLDSTFFCYDIGWYMYLDRDFYQSGRAWDDDGCGLSGAEHV